jgi:hypothetical protein
VLGGLGFIGTHVTGRLENPEQRSLSPPDR